MDKYSELTIYFSKKKIITGIRNLILLASILIGFISLLPPTNSVLVLLKKYILPFLAVILFATLLYFIRRYFDKSPGLIINSEGITDHSTGVSVGFIPWKEIRDIQLMKISTEFVINIEINNTKKYLSKNNIFINLMQRINLLFLKSPIQISTNTLDVTLEEMIDIIRSYSEKYLRA